MSGRVSSYSGPMQMDSLIQTMTGRLNQLANEVASNQKTNPAGSMGSGASLLYQLHTQSDQATALQTSIGMASQRLDTVQTVMSSIGSIAQTVANAGQDSQLNGVGNISAASTTSLAQQAQSAMQQILGQLNTAYAGSPLFAGNSTVSPMQAPGAIGGPTDTMNAILSAAVAANGGNPLSSADVANLVNGPNGIASVFTNTNSNPVQNFNGAFYTAGASSQPTTVLIGTNQTLQYNTQANQPAFRDLLQGLSMLSMAGAPSSQLDSTAQASLITQGLQLLSTAQNELTEMQGSLGSSQAEMQSAIDLQQSTAAATQQQLAGYEQPDLAADSTDLTALQTQLQAAYELTAQISQLSLTRYMPNPA
jgi:flagellar hook-associated protein 3 FlgL